MWLTFCLISILFLRCSCTFLRTTKNKPEEVAELAALRNRIFEQTLLFASPEPKQFIESHLISPLLTDIGKQENCEHFNFSGLQLNDENWMLLLEAMQKGPCKSARQISFSGSNISCIEKVFDLMVYCKKISRIDLNNIATITARKFVPFIYKMSFISDRKIHLNFSSCSISDDGIRRYMKEEEALKRNIDSISRLILLDNPLSEVAAKYLESWIFGKNGSLIDVLIEGPPRFMDHLLTSLACYEKMIEIYKEPLSRRLPDELAYRPDFSTSDVRRIMVEGEAYAVKIVENAQNIQNALADIFHHNILKHPNIMPQKWIKVTRFATEIWMPFATPLADIIKTYKPTIPADVCMEILYQLTLVIDYISPQLIHGNIKSSNIFINKDGFVQLSDFKLFSKPGRQSCHPESLLVELPWRSPEQDRMQEYDGKIDVWALGIVALELICDDFTAYHGQIINDISSLVESIPDPFLKNFVSLCLVEDANDRASAEQLMSLFADYEGLDLELITNFLSVKK